MLLFCRPTSGGCFEFKSVGKDFTYIRDGSHTSFPQVQRCQHRLLVESAKRFNSLPANCDCSTVFLFVQRTKIDSVPPFQSCILCASPNGLTTQSRYNLGRDGRGLNTSALQFRWIVSPNTPSTSIRSRNCGRCSPERQRSMLY
jgi:hypothetical protein